ncbi:MAG: pyridoxamine 5'-phosphate oxidase, partial [Betaproteobacteria bacterium]
ARGFAFYTNRDSRKGRALAHDARAALLFFWVDLERQLRIEGSVEHVADAEADAYFRSRPRASQLGAWASPQSAPVADRAALERRYDDVAQRYARSGETIPRPPHWGGYRVVPDAFEFWQGRRSRLHDRIAYSRSGDAWTILRLAP